MRDDLFASALVTEVYYRMGRNPVTQDPLRTAAPFDLVRLRTSESTAHDQYVMPRSEGESRMLEADFAYHRVCGLRDLFPFLTHEPLVLDDCELGDFGSGTTWKAVHSFGAI